jgi:cell division protein ZapA (FtsZ GTPase activity inhibitor)
MNEGSTFTIMGRSVPLRSDGNDDYLREVVDYVNRKVEEVKTRSQGMTDINAAILAMLNIADDYFLALGKQRAVFEQIDARCNDLIDFIDSKL